VLRILKNINSSLNLKRKFTMKIAKILFAATMLIAPALSSAAIITFQGANSPTPDVPMTAAEARAAWEQSLFSFTVDTIDGAVGSGAAGITTNAGNIYRDTGNGSQISIGTSNSLGGAPTIYGRRNGALLINFDVLFSSPVNAVGFDVLDNDGGGMSLTLTNSVTGLESTFEFDSVAGGNRIEFFGVVFEPDVFVSALEVGGTDPGGITNWDNFSFGVGQQAVDECTQDPSLPQCVNVNVSEPTHLSLVLLGFAGLALRRRLKK
jgi:hypothetical protein